MSDHSPPAPAGFDDWAHESHMDRAIELARAAVAAGDQPFGTVLVRDDEVVMEAQNRVETENDLAEHPELTLARRAAAERDDVADLVMYTSTEPCAMCAGGIYHSGLRTVVYSVSGARVGELAGSGGFSVPCSAIFAYGDDEVLVVSDVSREEGEAVHREYW